MGTRGQDIKFRGGIQAGTTAYDAESKLLDEQVSSISKRIHIPGLVMQRKLRKDQIPYGHGSCAPDGGLWFNEAGALVAVFEAKKQNNAGNAIERWYKNHYICRSINPSVSYITFASGEGCIDGGTITNTLAIAHENIFDVYRQGRNSCFRSVNGFTIDFIENKMISILGDSL